jgi:hypothetical protein
MIGSVFVASILLVAQIDKPLQFKDRPSTTPDAAVVAADQGQALAEYNALRAKAPATAAAQWRLGVWCEEHGLKDMAYVHFAEVARLDPRRDAAWRKLGFKKHGGHWTTDEQIAEENEQKKADKVWAPKLRKLHKDIHGTNGATKREVAQSEVDAITDPRAILAVYREFAGGGPSDQNILIQVLGQIDKPMSSQVLALLAVYEKTPEVRRRATESLRDRSADDFLPLLVSLMIDPFKYEVRPVRGPGSPGVLFVEGERFNVSRFYAPPPAPNITPQPGDIISYDQNGMPLISRPVGVLSSSDVKHGVPGSKTLVKETHTETDGYVEISPYQLALEAQKGAVAAEAQLEADVAMLKSINDDRKRFNDVIMAVAKDATGRDLGRTPKDWRDGLLAKNGSPKRSSQVTSKPTFPEMVPLAYNPTFSPVGFGIRTLKSTQVYVDT